MAIASSKEENKMIAESCIKKIHKYIAVTQSSLNCFNTNYRDDTVFIFCEKCGDIKKVEVKK